MLRKFLKNPAKAAKYLFILKRRIILKTLGSREIAAHKLHDLYYEDLVFDNC
jgi:hypothetical protein